MIPSIAVQLSDDMEAMERCPEDNGSILWDLEHIIASIELCSFFNMMSSVTLRPFHKDLSALTSHQMLKNRVCGCRLHKHKRLDHQHPASDGCVFMHSVSRLS